MIWISNNDPPLYVWQYDEWFNQKDNLLYHSDLYNMQWSCSDPNDWNKPSYRIKFPNKTRIFMNGQWWKIYNGKLMMGKII